MTQSALLSPQDEDWRRFRNLTSMVNHWDRPGWTPGRRAYYWYLTFDSASLQQLAAKCQTALRLPYLDPVPLNELHLTLPRVGWADEISPEEANAVAQAAIPIASQLQPFGLTVGPVAGSAGAVRFSVSPWEPVFTLHNGLRDAIRTVRGEVCSEGEFRPHVGVSYCNSAVSPTALIDALEKLRSLPPVEVTVTKADLVLLWRRGRTYTWSTVRSLTLG